MPVIVISAGDSNPGGTVTVRHAAQATSTQVASVVHVARATSASTTVEVRHVALRSASVTTELRHRATANLNPAWPLAVRAGRPPRRTVLTSNGGQVISADYQHSGTRESMTLTLAGIVQPLTGQLSLGISESEGTRSLGTLSLSLDADPTQFEHKQTSTGGTTALYSYNKAAARLGSVRLPELIPWKLSPTPLPDRRVPCSARPKPQTIGVSGVVQAAFQAAGMSLTFPHGDPLAGETWKEGERDYSTKDKTPDSVFADTYGQLSYTYVVRRTIAYALPAGQGFSTASVVATDLTGDLTIRGEAANTPSKVTLAGGPLVLDKPDIIQLLSVAPDAESLSHELVRDAEWYKTETGPGSEITRGFRKSAGKITHTAELTVSDVTVQEQVNGVQVERTFSRVVTGFVETINEYDPTCTDALIRQTTTHKSWGYGLNTVVTSGSLSGPGFSSGLAQLGDPLGDETQIVTSTFSEQGWLSHRSTETTKLVTLQQANAEGQPDQRGALQAYEYVSQTLSESFQPSDGSWYRTWTQTGGQRLPVYDADSKEAARLGARGGVVTSGGGPMDSAPEQVRCPDPCTDNKIFYPQVLVSNLPDGREGQEVSRTLGMVAESSALTSYLNTILASLGATVASDATLSQVRDWRPGVELAGAVTGIVESYSLKAEKGMATASISVREQLAGIGSAPAAEESDGPYRDQVLWRLPGGVVVNHLQDIEDGSPVFKRIFVRVSGAVLPNPGDELEWMQDSKFGPTATGNYGN
ncbi:hypothetical protein [Deinococcus ruber]|uniref:Uncharacterized protein n=1 Tax=Deinococcus ruber TaxID=1848197 RepID=A0A918CQS2_9DEIO|nr:hypothetical protein [Deinococcus ruber]GGR34154.1 hypothetical protein GCM10008957_50450 [Deinococcus ruber]